MKAKKILLQPGVPIRSGIDRLLDKNEFEYCLTYFAPELKRNAYEINSLFAQMKSNGIATSEGLINSLNNDQKLYNGPNNKNTLLNRYILYNIIFERIPKSRQFIEEYKQLFIRNRNALRFWYDRDKPRFFPSLDSITARENQYFLFALTYLHESEKLNDKIVMDELLYYYLKSNFRSTMSSTVKEFANHIYPILVANNIMHPRENIVQYLIKRITGQPISEQELVKQNFQRVMSVYKGTNFHTILERFVQFNLEQGNYVTDTLLKYITYWGRFTEFLCKKNIDCVSKVKAMHRDMFLNEALKTDWNVARLFKCIKGVLKFNNKHFEKKANISLFSGKYVPKVPKDVKHIGIMNSAINALVGCVFSEIWKSRQKPFEELTLTEKKHFFLDRAIWFMFLYGPRVSEILGLTLEQVKQSLSYEKPYIHLITAKNAEDTDFNLTSADEPDEYKLIHYEILLEIVEKAELVYQEVPVQQKFLFPNPVHYGKYSLSALYLRLRHIQEQNGLVYGRVYDIFPRGLYESIPDLRKKLGKALFNPHALRAINVHLLYTIAKLSTYEVQKTKSWRSKLSEQHYTETMLDTLRVFKIRGKKP